MNGDSGTAQELVRNCLKTPYRDGTTHVIFEPLMSVCKKCLHNLASGFCNFAKFVPRKVYTFVQPDTRGASF